MGSTGRIVAIFVLLLLTSLGLALLFLSRVELRTGQADRAGKQTFFRPMPPPAITLPGSIDAGWIDCRSVHDIVGTLRGAADYVCDNRGVTATTITSDRGLLVVTGAYRVSAAAMPATRR